MAHCIIDIRVIPRSARSCIDGTRDGAILVRLNAPPVDGAANTELLDLLAEVLDVPKRVVTIVHGERGRLKRVRVDGLDHAEVMKRLSTKQ